MTKSRSEYNKEYWAEHKEELSIKKKKYYQENKEKINERSKIWFKENRDRWNKYQRERIAKKRRLTR